MASDQTQKCPAIAEVKEEFKKMTDIGFPIFAMGLLNYLKNMTLVVSMGRLGSLELAGGALAIGLTNITGYSVLSGLAMGMEPLCSQAFGSRNLILACRILRRTIIMLLFASIPIGLSWVNLKPFMLLLHQDPQVVDVASMYCRFSLPDLVAISFLHPIRIYLRSKNTTWPLLWCTLLSIILHFPITFFLTFYLKLGIKGIAVSSSISDFNVLFFLLVHIVNTQQSTIKGTLATPLLTNSTSLGEDWGMLIRLSLPSCAAVCLEWWWYEIMTFLSGYLDRPRVALATSAIVIQTTSLLYTLPSALSASASTRVGNELGAGRPYRAHLATIIAIGLAFLSSMFGFLLTTVGRQSWGRVFTTDNEVLQLTIAILPVIGLCELANCPQTTCSGVLRGIAKPSSAAAINFCSFYLVGTPVGITLAFFWKQGFMGLCYGLLAAQVACMVSIVAVVSKTDWERESVKAKDLVGESDYVYTEQGSKV